MRARDASAAVRLNSDRGGALRARCLWLAPGATMSRIEVRWNAAGRIVALRRVRGPVEDLCVFPGLVDSHTHLQIEPVAAPREFVPWAAAVMAARAGVGMVRFRQAARDNALQLLSEGTTSVGEVDSTGVGPGALATMRLAGRCYQEVTGFHLDGEGARQLVRARRRHGSATLGAGISPHAPYSVSPALFAAAAGAARHLSIHCAETEEEQAFLHHGRGPFAELLQRLGRLPAGFRPPGAGAVRWLHRLGVLRASTQLVHCQQLEAGDVELLAAAGCAVVVCPGTIEWFGRRPPPVPDWLRAGIPVALGTDSRASNDSWSLRSALAAAARLWPMLSPSELLTMATTAGARALSRSGLGRLRIGGRADLFAVAASSDDAAAHVEPLVRGDCRPRCVVLGGRLLPTRSGLER